MHYADIIYDQSNNDSFKNKLEKIQYNAALAITGAIQGTSRDKINKEIGLESLQFRRSLNCLCTFHKTKYFLSIFDQISRKPSFFPWIIVHWNKLDSKIQNLSSSALKEHLIKGIRPPPNSVFNEYS